MTNYRPDRYEDGFAAAIKLFWDTRDQQARAQLERGVTDTGTRGAVTGGGHLLPMAVLIEQIFNDCGIPMLGGSHVLPGYYRSTKAWDGVVTYKGELVAILELKSQVGSFGKNQNNRIEEIIGQGRDINMAARRDLLGRLPPWFGYLMIVEDHATSRARSKGSRPHPQFPLDEAFSDAPSTIERYSIALNRMRLEGEIRAACLVATSATTHDYWYPDETLSFSAFSSAIRGRVIEVLGAID